LISRVGQAGAEATTVTIPAGHQVGDLLVICAFRDGSTTNPTVPAGWTTITATFDGTSCSVSAGWKYATSAAETSGTWTNATGLLCVVLRGVTDVSPIMDTATSAGTTNTVTYAALSDANLRAAIRYYIFAFIMHRSVDVTIEQPPTGMNNILKTEGSTNDMAIHEATADDAWPSTNVAISGTASGWQSIVLAIRPPRENFESRRRLTAGTGNTGIITTATIG
jgi:hypothetical protein